MVWICFICLLFPGAGFASEGLKIGTKAPNFFAHSSNGKIFRLYRAGTMPKIVNFWWVSCAPCRKEMPELASLEKQHPKIKFLVVHTVSSDNNKIPSFLKDIRSVPSNILMGSEALLELYKFKTLPHTAVLDGANIVRLVVSGYTKENVKKLKKIITKLDK